MKKNILLMALAVASFALTSCSDDTSEGKSRITYYPTIEINGDNPYLVAKGSTYTDPGYVSIMGGQDVSDKVTVTGIPDTSKSGDYTVTYTTAKNEDGFEASATRRVIVADANDPVEGLYWVAPTSYRLRAGAQVAYGASYPIVVLNNGDGTYTADDMLGGWYYYRAGYGVRYAMKAIFSVADDGTVTLLGSIVPGWGDSHDDYTGTFDAATGTFSMNTVYAGMDFVQTWVKQQ
jgi:hypothetical protein